MQITLKLYGGLKKYLPENTSSNEAIIEIDKNFDVEQALNSYSVPPNQRHLVMVNGVYIKPEERTTKILSEADSLAVWPPSTG